MMNRFLNYVAFGQKLAFGAAFVLLTAAPGQAGLVTFAAFGADPAAITTERDDASRCLGRSRRHRSAGAFHPASFGGLRREINWDGVPDARADPNLLPGDSP